MVLVFLFLLFGDVNAKKRLDPAANFHVNSIRDASPPWTVKWFTTKLDHFTYSDTRTFQMKWLINNTHYKPGGPIFFYTGNEGDIEGFAAATGMMWDLAPRFNAAIIFAEHRFYGQSLPFGNRSYESIDRMGYLTSEQALADYAALLFALKNNKSGLDVSYPEETPVISFGGSYGGMLSAWFRIKYPHVVAGAWAASAPLIYFKGGGVDQGAFDAVTTKTFVDAGTNRLIVANTWNAVLNLSSTENGRKFLNDQFRIDPKSLINRTEDGWLLNAYFREAIEYMAMVDYPYATGFLEPLPAWPVKVASKYMSASGSNFTDQQLATMMYNAANVYYNFTGGLQYNCINPSVCGDPGTSGLGDAQLGWPWQECSEIVIDMCAKGYSNDFFWDECKGNSTALLVEQCQGIFGKFNWTPKVWNLEAIPLLYGLSLAGSSNIILTQGELDPWSSGGYQAGAPGVNQDVGIYILKIPGAAHHLDLRTPNTCDPNTVNNARFQIVQILDCWIRECPTPPQLTKLPSLVIPDIANCTDVNHGYPWHQSSSVSSLFPTLVGLCAVLLRKLS